MFARMARFEGLDRTSSTMHWARSGRERKGGTPQGILAVEALFLVDRSSGELAALSLYETEEDMRTGDATLRQMTPPVPQMQRPDVRMYEVALRRP